jgi:hypothetical protein
MRKSILWLCMTITLLAAGTPLIAQSPYYNNGPVWRVIYIHIKPGMGDMYWKDISEHVRPIYEEYKKQGWIVDYKFYTNPVSEHPDDWDVAIALEYKNFGTFDEMGDKAATLAAKHYGSRDAMIEAGKKRSDWSSVVRNSLAREVTLK